MAAGQLVFGGRFSSIMASIFDGGNGAASVWQVVMFIADPGTIDYE